MDNAQARETIDEIASALKKILVELPGDGWPGGIEAWFRWRHSCDILRSNMETLHQCIAKMDLLLTHAVASRLPLKRGDRIETFRQVERFPHFCIDAGKRGTVVDTGSESGNVWVRMDEPIYGCEEWQNQINWDADEKREELGVVWSDAQLLPPRADGALDPIAVQHLAEVDAAYYNAARRRNSEVRRLLIMPKGERSFETSLDSFLTDNAEDEQTCAVARGLRLGDQYTFGGGAQPEVTIQRIGDGPPENIPPGDRIYEAVMKAMQEAEEIDGPEGEEYVRLMARIEEEASKRWHVFLKLRTPSNQ